MRLKLQTTIEFMYQWVFIQPLKPEGKGWTSGDCHSLTFIDPLWLAISCILNLFPSKLLHLSVSENPPWQTFLGPTRNHPQTFWGINLYKPPSTSTPPIFMGSKTKPNQKKSKALREGDPSFKSWLANLIFQRSRHFPHLRDLDEVVRYEARWMLRGGSVWRTFWVMKTWLGRRSL